MSEKLLWRIRPNPITKTVSDAVTDSLRVGFDPYESATRPLIVAACMAKRSGFKLVEFSPRLEWFAYSNRVQQPRGRKFDKVKSPE